MKVIFTQCFAVCSFLFLVTCTKTETNIIQLEGPHSAFETYVTPDITQRFQQKLAAPINAAFYFKNLSDSGDMITYHWDFGDGHTSSDWQPVHQYSVRGHYQVTLETRLAGKPSDKSIQPLYAFVGQTDFSLGVGTDFAFVDFHQLDDRSFVALGYRRSSNNRDTPPLYFLQYLDEYHREITSHALPAGYHYGGIARVEGGDYVAWHDGGSANQPNELIKLSADGNLRWHKKLDHVTQIHAVHELSDGGLMILAERPVLNNHAQYSPRSYVIKTDADAVVQWDYHFVGLQDMYGTGSMVEEADGYVLVGADVDDDHPTCWSCTSFSLVKMGNDGTVRWRKHTPWGTTNSGGLTWVYKRSDGGFLVASRGAQGLYYLSPDGVFQDRRLMPKHAHSVALTTNGNVVMQGEEVGNGFRANTYGFNQQGVWLWEKRIDGQFGESCCADSWTVKVTALRQGGVMAVANRIDRVADHFSDYHYVGVLQELTDQGELQ